MGKFVVRFFSKDIPYSHKKKKIFYSWIQDTVARENHTVEFINVIFCNDEYLYSLNTNYLNHDTFTDVISFQYSTEPIEGDIFISVDRVFENAQSLNVSFSDELARVIIHGVLHFCGYSDKTKDEKNQMRALESYYLSLLNV